MARMAHAQVCALVKRLIDEGQTPTMVCSAMGKTTNNLLNAGDFALKDGKVCALHMWCCWCVAVCGSVLLLLLLFLLFLLLC